MYSNIIHSQHTLFCFLEPKKIVLGFLNEQNIFSYR